MADQGRWWKLHVSALDDPHLDNLDIAQFGRWCKLGAFIKKHGTNGSIIIAPPSRALVAKMQVASFEDMIRCFEEMPNLTVSHGTNTTVSFSNWLKYQGDFSTTRTQKFRIRERSKRRGEERRREEKREEIKDNSLKMAESPALETNNGCPPEWLPVKAHLQTLTWLNRPELLNWDFWKRLDEALSAFPDLSITEELSRAEAWLIANPRKATTKKRWTQFILNWFQIAAERKAKYEKGQGGSFRFYKA